MSDIVSLLEEKTPESLEKVFVVASQEKIVALDDEAASLVLVALKEVLDDSAVVSNAKQRRRLTRLISSIEDRGGVAAKLSNRNSESKSGDPAEGSATRNVEEEELSIEEVMRRLDQGAEDRNKLESLLNGLKIPPKDPTTGEHSDEFLKIRVALKASLESVLHTSPLMETKSLQRRVSRLIYSLLTTEEKDEEKRKAALKPKIAPPAPKAKKEYTGVEDGGEVAGPTSFLSAIASLKEASASDAVEAAIADINFTEVHSAVLEEVEEMKSLVDAIIADEARSGNAKLRRRLGRLKESLDKVNIATAAAAAGPASGEPRSGNISFSDVLAAVNSAKDGNELESSITGMPASVDSNDEEGVKGMLELEKLLTRLSEDKDMVSTAPQRRKIKRALEAISKLRDSVPTAGAKGADDDEEDEEEDVDVVMVHNPKPGPPLEDVIKAVRDATSAEDLETAVKNVKPGHGNNKSRRTLKRALTTVMGDEKREWTKDLNSKARRGISRVLQGLEPVPESGVKTMKRSHAIQDEDVLAGVSKKDRTILTKKARTEGDAAEGPQEKEGSNPYILFIGQLSFGTLKDQLEKHICANGVSEIKSIRILTDDSGNSRGMAFVELNTTEDMHKGLSLHHSVLHGRRLNVEKSCGGRNKDARQARIANFRDDQSKAVAEKIDAVIADFETRQVITRAGLGSLLLKRLHTFSARQVGDMLAEFENRPKEQRTLKDLDQICSALNTRLGRQNIEQQGELDQQEMDVQDD